MTKARRIYLESFKQEAVDEALADTPLRHVAHALDMTEALLGKWKRQFRDAGPDAFPGSGSKVSKRPNPNAFAMTWSASPWSATNKKSARHLLATHEVKFRAIEALTARYPLAPMCQLFRVSRSGYYAWLRRKPSMRKMANRKLLREIRLVHAEINGIVGHRRIHAELMAQGLPCGRSSQGCYT